MSEVTEVVETEKGIPEDINAIDDSEITVTIESDEEQAPKDKGQADESGQGQYDQ